jgi:hypothetical protein
VLVGWLLAIRLLGKGDGPVPHPRIALASGAVALITLLFVLGGPLQPGWNATANNGNGSGARGSASVSAASVGMRLPFTAQLQGSLSQSAGGSGGVRLQIDTTLSGGEQGNLQIVLDGQPVGNGSVTIDGGRVTFSPQSGSSSYSGSLVSFAGNQLVAICSDGSGKQVHLNISIQDDGSGNASGSLQAS